MDGAGLATRVVHLAPPDPQAGGQWWRDKRTQALLLAEEWHPAPVIAAKPISGFSLLFRVLLNSVLGLFKKK